MNQRNLLNQVNQVNQVKLLNQLNQSNQVGEEANERDRSEIEYWQIEGICVQGGTGKREGSVHRQMAE